MSVRDQLVLLFMAIGAGSQAQVLCVLCYDQNEAMDSLSTNLILNGSLEDHDCIPWPEASTNFCPSALAYDCDIAYWTCTGGGPYTYAQMFNNTWSAIPDGQVGAYFGNDYCQPCPNAADTSCMTWHGCIVDGIPDGYPTNQPDYGGAAGVSLSQSVTGLIPFSTYVLEFWAGGESGFSVAGVFAVDVGFGNIFLRCKPTDVAETGTRYQVVFTASSTSHTIKFTNWGHFSLDATELILDDVRLTAPAILPCSPTTLPEAVAQAGRIMVLEDQLLVTVNARRRGWLVLHDGMGQTLLQRSVSGTQRVPLHHLPAGAYSYQLRIDGERPMYGRFVNN